MRDFETSCGFSHHSRAWYAPTWKFEPRTARCRSALARGLYGLSLLSFALCPPEAIAAANKTSTTAPAKVATHPEETPIPVATDAGVIPMTQRDYDEYVKTMGHLPVMSKAYIFGQKIPLPKTDKLGHIHLSDPSAPAPRKSD
jgi:hypothetical protein